MKRFISVVDYEYIVCGFRADMVFVEILSVTNDSYYITDNGSFILLNDMLF